MAEDETPPYKIPTFAFLYLIGNSELAAKYMNEECYKIICKVYYEHKNVDDISKETKIPKEEVDRMLDYGYEKLIRIVKSDY